MAAAHLGNHFRYLLRKSHVYCECCHYHQHGYYPDAHHHATVNVSGVALVNVRLHCWQALAARALMLAPGVIVTLGTVAELINTSTSPLTGCVLVHPHPPPQGTYAMIPSAWIVATYRFVPAGAILLTENFGAKTGVESAQHL